MQNVPDVLFEAIRTRCRQASWFGPDALKPDREVQPQPDDPFLDEYASASAAQNDPRRAGFVFPPATEEQIRVTESTLGFALPQMLRELYLRVANGGFGPGTGLRGVEGGYKGAYHHYTDFPGTQGSSHAFSSTTYDAFAVPTEAGGGRASLRVPCEQWLAHLLPICDLGCGEEAAVESQGRMFLLSPTESNAFYHLERLPWAFEEWLWRWVRGENLLDAHPSDAA
jgi:hypothetical protein